VNTYRLPQTIIQLLKKGVRILNPSSIPVSDDTSPDRIAEEGVVFYPGAPRLTHLSTCRKESFQ